jgi:hypothetical protein
MRRDVRDTRFAMTAARSQWSVAETAAAEAEAAAANITRGTAQSEAARAIDRVAIIDEIPRIAALEARITSLHAELNRPNSQE